MNRYPFLLILATIFACSSNDGAMGPMGPAGPQGETGPQGPRGETGTQGSQGESATFAITFLEFPFTSSLYDETNIIRLTNSEIRIDNFFNLSFIFRDSNGLITSRLPISYLAPSTVIGTGTVVDNAIPVNLIVRNGQLAIMDYERYLLGFMRSLEDTGDVTGVLAVGILVPPN